MRWAVVTGASSGIGLEFAHQLAERGYSVLMVSNQDNELVEWAEKIHEQYGVATIAHRLDLTDPNATDSIIGVLRANSIVPEVLVNNAGIFDFKKVEELGRRRLNLYIDLHIRAVTMLSTEIAMMMATEAQKGYILNMSSMSCWMPMPGIAMYSATKAYIRAFSRALRVEMKDYGVSVTVACPGGIATSLFGLPEKWRKFAVRIGVLATPHTFVRRALRKMFRRKAQYINGGLNRVSIVAVAMLPEWGRVMIKRIGLDRHGKKENKGK